MYRNRDDAEKADALIERATRARPDDPAPYLVLSSLRGRQGDLEGALEAADHAREVSPDHPAGALRRAEVLLEIGVRDDDAEGSSGRRREYQRHERSSAVQT